MGNVLFVEKKKKKKTLARKLGRMTSDNWPEEKILLSQK